MKKATVSRNYQVLLGIGIGAGVVAVRLYSDDRAEPGRIW